MRTVIAAAAAGLFVAGLGVPMQAASGPQITQPLGNVQVEGCKSFRQTISDTNTAAFKFTAKARCFAGKRLRLRYKQATSPGGKTRFWGGAKAFGHRLKLSGPADHGKLRVRIDGKNISRAGEGTLVRDTALERAHAFYTLGRTGYACTRWGGSWQDWSLQLHTRRLTDSHYHGTPTKAQRRGLPWAVCAAMLTMATNTMPTNW